MTNKAGPLVRESNEKFLLFLYYFYGSNFVKNKDFEISCSNEAYNGI